MAFSFGGSSGGMRGRRFGAGRASGGSTLSEINVVPLVDVVLVLLIIFMLTAQAMEFGLEIQVPQVKNVTQTSEDLPLVSLSRDGKLYLGEKPVSNINLLGAEIAKRYKGAKAVYVRADKSAQWEQLASVISQLGAAHYDVKAVTKPYDIPN
jgi:biopolymer transport protein ExbD